MFKTALLATLGVVAGLVVISAIGSVVGVATAAAEESYNKHKAKQLAKAKKDN